MGKVEYRGRQHRIWGGWDIWEDRMGYEEGGI